MIDVCMAVLEPFQPETLAVRLVSLLAGCMIMSVGVSVEVAPA